MSIYDTAFCSGFLSPIRFRSCAVYWMHMISRYTHQNLTWIDLESPTREEILTLSDDIDLHPVIANELLEPSERAKVDVYSNSMSSSTRSTSSARYSRSAAISTKALLARMRDSFFMLRSASSTSTRSSSSSLSKRISAMSRSISSQTKKRQWSRAFPRPTARS